jgi:transcriptional regulator with GAF, ATPase, and Fis domain
MPRTPEPDLYPSLLEIAKLLLAEEDDGKAPEILLRRALEATGTDRGFIVVREGDAYEEKFDIRFDRSTISGAARKFSRGLVRQAIETRQIIHSTNTAEDPRFAQMQSIQASNAGAVLVAPLLHGDEVYGVVYLQHGDPLRGLPDDARRFLAEFIELAGVCLRRALERDAMRRRNRSLERDLFAQHDFEGIVTRHPRMLALLGTVAQVAASDATVLIHGETGTGKELIARALHVNSPRRSKPCVTLHTTALPGTILESELFGHVKGAFTGADRDRTGRIASAAGGTLFLDEVAEIAPDVQAKLLRFLQFGEIQRVGSDRTEKIDVRVLAATHQDLPALIEAGKFRRDLYYRLKVIELTIVPLRERESDIPLLIEHFLRLSWKRSGERPRFTARAELALRAHPYPGNVRELAHLVERACILARGPELDIDLLPAELTMAGPGHGIPTEHSSPPLTIQAFEAAREAVVTEMEATFLTDLMKHHGGNVSQAARESGIHRGQLQKMLARHRKPEGG